MLCCLSLLLTACSIGPMTLGPSPSPSKTSNTFPDPITGTGYPPGAPVALAQLTWCRYNTQELRFWDYGGSATASPTLVTDWQQIQSKLGFTVYLPAQLSTDVCLTLVQGDLNNPQGNTFSIIYSYYQRVYTNRLVILEQAAKGTSTSLQCSVPSESAALEFVASGETYSSKNPEPHLCKGQIDQTTITIQAPESAQQLTADIQAFQASVTFIPTCHCQNDSEHVFRIHV